MKIAFVYTTSRLFWGYAYQKYAWLRHAEYNVQLGTLLDEPYSFHSGYQPVLQRRGHECMTCFPGIEPLEQAWTRENGRPQLAVPEAWQVVLEQLIQFQPEAVFCSLSNAFDPQFAQALGSHVRSLRAVIGYAGSFTVDGRRMASFDAVITCSQDVQSFLQNQRLRAYYLPHSFDAISVRRLLGDRSDPTVNRIVFSGNLERRKGVHLERARLLGEIAERVPLAIYSPAAERSESKDLLDWAVRGMAARSARALLRVPVVKGVAERSFAVRRLSKIHLANSPFLPAAMRKVLRPPVFGLDAFRIYRAYTATLNHSGEYETAENMRLFEATGAGACLLTDWKPNLPQYFEIDREIVTYRSADECVEKAGWLLDHPAEAAAIGVAAREKCLANYTFEQRADEMIHIMSEVIGDSASRRNRDRAVCEA